MNLRLLLRFRVLCNTSLPTGVEGGATHEPKAGCDSEPPTPRADARAEAVAVPHEDNLRVRRIPDPPDGPRPAERALVWRMASHCRVTHRTVVASDREGSLVGPQRDDEAA